jgi:hypothetical protein
LFTHHIDSTDYKKLTKCVRFGWPPLSKNLENLLASSKYELWGHIQNGWLSHNPTFPVRKDNRLCGKQLTCTYGKEESWVVHELYQNTIKRT